MTSPDQPAPGQDTPESGPESGPDSGPVEGAGESGDVDPREPMEDASDMSPAGGGSEAPEPQEPPD